MTQSRKIVLLAALGIILLLALAARAQDTLTLGEAVQGELTTDAPEARYEYEGMAGQSIILDLSSRDFDTYLQLLDPDGEEIAANDDSAGLLDSQIGPLELPVGGVYTVVVTSSRHHSNPDQFATGSYTLKLGRRGTSPDTTPTVGEGESIEVGSSVTGNLNRARGEVKYRFAAQKGDEVLMTVTSRDFDAYLTLLDPDGEQIASDDDSGGSLNPRIGPLVLESDGMYTIVVTSYSSSGAGGSGEFTLSLTEPSADVIPFNEEIIGEMPRDEETVIYTLRGEAGDTVVITVLSNDIYAYIDLASASEPEESLVSGEAYYESVSAGTRIGPYTFSEDGYYLLTVTAYEEFGDFSLRVDRVSLQALDYGDSVEVDINADVEAYYFSFEGESGQVVNITVDGAESVDTRLTVTSPTSTFLASDDDGGDGFNPEIARLILNEEGTHYILLESYLGDEGQVRLTLNQQVLASLDDGSHQLRLTSERSEDVVTFTATAREKVRLNVAVLGLRGTTGAPYVTVTQGGETIAYASVSNISKVSLEFIVPHEGTVHVLVEDYSYSRVTLQLSLERVPDV